MITGWGAICAIETATYFFSIDAVASVFNLRLKIIRLKSCMMLVDVIMAPRSRLYRSKVRVPVCGGTVCGGTVCEGTVCGGTVPTAVDAVVRGHIILRQFHPF